MTSGTKDNKSEALRSVDLRDRIHKALDAIRPNLMSDGGNIELVAVDQNVVSVRLKGACRDCPMSWMTMQWGVIDIIRRSVPEIVDVRLVT